VRGNAGDYRPFTLKVPEGTILNCRKPAAVTFRQRIGWYTAPNALVVLAEGAPDSVRAFWGLPFIVTWNVTNPDGSTYADMVFSGGGQGASSGGDGKSGLIWPTSAANTSLEMFEVRMPILVLEKTFTPDSGGAGKFRGGLGARIRLRKLEDDGVKMVAAVFPETVEVQHPGLFGGHSGGMASARVVGANGALIESCGAAQMVALKSKTQILELQIAGGSGYGNPSERAIAMIEEDLLDGYVTTAGVERDYGVSVPRK
jgi:5-oxoprolinase (ATP-hydrolysing)